MQIQIERVAMKKKRCLQILETAVSASLKSIIWKIVNESLEIHFW